MMSKVQEPSVDLMWIRRSFSNAYRQRRKTVLTAMFLIQLMKAAARAKAYMLVSWLM